MRLIAMLVMLFAAAFAGQVPHEQMDSCLKGCCESAGGSWSMDNICDINESAGEFLSKCELDCVYSTTGVEGGGPGCCAPAIILFAVAGAALKVGA